MDPVTAAAGFQALGSMFGGMGSPQAAPAISDAYGASVNVGGLNVPAFPNFPSNMYSASTGQSITAGGSSNTLFIAGAVVIAAVLFKRFK